MAGHRVAFATASGWGVARLLKAHHYGRLQDELARYERTSLIVTSDKPRTKAHMFRANLYQEGPGFMGSWSSAESGAGSC